MCVGASLGCGGCSGWTPAQPGWIFPSFFSPPPENPLQGGAGGARPPRRAVPVLQCHLPQRRGHPWAQVLHGTQDRGHGEAPVRGLSFSPPPHCLLPPRSWGTQALMGTLSSFWWREGPAGWVQGEKCCCLLDAEPVVYQPWCMGFCADFVCTLWWAGALSHAGTVWESPKRSCWSQFWAA